LIRIKAEPIPICQSSSQALFRNEDEMTYKSILTIVLSPEAAEAQILAAAQVAKTHDAHLQVLALGVDKTQLGYAYIGAGAALMAETLDIADEDARACEAASRKALGQLGPDLRWSLDGVAVQTSSLMDVVANAARFSDLVILPLPYGEGRGLDSETVIEAAMFEGRAPVLVLPAGATPITLGQPKRVVLAWNQSNEALAATRAALPLLKYADRVDITVIAPPAHGLERSDPGGTLAEMLVRHGVKAEVSVLALNLPSASDVIGRHAEDIGADLIVMGAYGHSRIREAVLGGATRAMLQKAKVPVLMAH
jgi:nucleotide-binding universal stress UspA family protein